MALIYKSKVHFVYYNLEQSFKRPGPSFCRSQMPACPQLDSLPGTWEPFNLFSWRSPCTVGLRMTLWGKLKALLTDAAALENQDCTLLLILKFHHRGPRGQRANEADPWHLSRVPRSPATPLFDTIPGKYKFISRLYIIPKSPQHNLPSLCWWSWKMTALGWTIWNCHLYTSTVVECWQFNLMVIIYFWEYSWWSTFTSIIPLILRTEMWGRGYWLSFIDEKIEAHKTHLEFAFVPSGGYL